MAGVLRNLGDFSSDVDKSREAVDTDGAKSTPGLLTKRITELEQVLQRGPAFSLADLPAYVNALQTLNGPGMDDRKFLLEKMVTLMSRLPTDSKFASTLQKYFIDLLYKDLPHPPGGYLALPPNGLPPQDEARPVRRYAYRTGDGSNYNPLMPNLGRAGTPYARSVPSTITIPASALPDPGVLFDTLLKRETFKPHPGGLSSLFFAFANLIIHSCFHTNSRDWMVNDVSSYLDLSPLYGSSDADVEKIRKHDGTGRIWDDCFMDSRILLMPPSTNALLVIFNRNHNFVAQKLLAINERGTYKAPSSLSGSALSKQDDELFHRARLVNCGFFMQGVFRDYVGAILGCQRDGSSWRLDPLQSTRELDHELSPRGQGNACAIEFNLLYRWHATISAQDQQWTENEFARIFGTRDFGNITIQEFAAKAQQALKPPEDIKAWTFNGLQRDQHGRFRDSDLASILHDATSWPAAAFHARGIPEVMRVVEMLGIEQSRQWGTCSLNEFRSFIGLKPYETFADWNPDPEIQKAAEGLYHHIDNLELHVGLQAEDTKPSMPGAGLCPGYTISRAILSDAVCLTRGDRFYTVDFTPFNCTAWGYQDCFTNEDDGSYGGIMSKLLFRSLPDYYPPNSAYGHFPLMVPEKMREFMTERDDKNVNKYVWSRPPAPTHLVVVDTHDAAQQIIGNPRLFKSNYGEHLSQISSSMAEDRELVNSALTTQETVHDFKREFLMTTGNLIKEKSFQRVNSPTYYVDIVKDVINLVPVHIIANRIIGLPMKTVENPYGLFREHGLYDDFAEVCNYAFIDQEPFYHWTLRERASHTMQEVSEYARAHLEKLSKGVLSVGGISDTVKKWVSARNDNSDDFLRSLLDLGKGRSRTSAQLAGALSAVVATAAHFSAALANVVDYYLDDARAQARQEIANLARTRGVESEQQLLRFVYAALRAQPAVSFAYRKATSNAPLAHGDRVVTGQTIFVNLAAANSDPVTGTPHGGIFDLGEHGFMGAQFFDAVAPQVLRAVFSLRNIARAPGASGVLNGYTDVLHGSPVRSYTNLKGENTPFPPSLVVQYGDRPPTAASSAQRNGSAAHA